MTYSNTNSNSGTDSGDNLSEYQVITAANTGEASSQVHPPGKTAPKYFLDNPINFQITNNEYTSGPYYYDVIRNTWIFYTPGTYIPSPPPNPDAGNLWIDPTNMYLMYVYNENDFSFPDATDNTWYALTTNKRAYDYLIVPLAMDGDINVVIPPDRINIFKQSYLYFNRSDLDLKVRVEQKNEQGDVIGHQWASITQRAINAVNDPSKDFNDTLPAPALRQLHNSIGQLEQRVEALKEAVGI